MTTVCVQNVFVLLYVLTTSSKKSVGELPYPIRMFELIVRLKVVVAATIEIGATELPESNATVNVGFGYVGFFPMSLRTNKSS